MVTVSCSTKCVYQRILRALMGPDAQQKFEKNQRGRSLTHKVDGDHLFNGTVVEVGDADVHEGHVEGREHDEAARQPGLLSPVIEAGGRHMKGEMRYLKLF